MDQLISWVVHSSIIYPMHGETLAGRPSQNDVAIVLLKALRNLVESEGANILLKNARRVTMYQVAPVGFTGSRILLDRGYYFETGVAGSQG